MSTAKSPAISTWLPCPWNGNERTACDAPHTTSSVGRCLRLAIGILNGAKLVMQNPCTAGGTSLIMISGHERTGHRAADGTLGLKGFGHHNSTPFFGARRAGASCERRISRRAMVAQHSTEGTKGAQLGETRVTGRANRSRLPGSVRGRRRSRDNAETPGLPCRLAVR